MANILITTRCMRGCPFCFARERIAGKSKTSPVDMTREDLRRIMDFLERSGEREFRLLGGEPTLHPEFADIVAEAVHRDFHVLVFSNGIMSKDTADFLGQWQTQQVSVLLNVSPQAKDTEVQKERVRYTMERLGDQAQLGVTLTESTFDFDFLLSDIRRYKLRKRIRLGLAQPIVGEENAYLDPGDYREVGMAIVEMSNACAMEDILLGFDCGLTLCMFSEREIGTLVKNSEGFETLCRPIIDIGPDLVIWHCFPLSGVLNAHLDWFQTRNHAVHHYQKAVRPYRTMGCMSQCLTCDHLRRGQCPGGCLAHAMNALHPQPPKWLDAD